MLRISGRASLVLSFLTLSAPLDAQTPFERQVLEILNQARTNPTSYAETLKRYKTYFHDKIVSLPGQPADIETEEGIAVVEETINFLNRQTPLAPVATAPLLEGASADHVHDQSTSGETGHEGSDGSSPAQRVKRRGGGSYVAEVIAYGPVDAADAVRQLIVDDGVEDRGHRQIIFSPELRFAGVSCGKHPEFSTMCVIDMSVTADAREAGNGTRVAHADVPQNSAN
jgi:uncharacterized protein YkwD